MIICPLSVLFLCLYLYFYMGIFLSNGKNMAGLSLAKLLLKFRLDHFACDEILEIILKLCTWRGLYLSISYFTEYQL